MLPPLASLPEFIARVPGDVAVDDWPRAEAALQDASALVRAEAGLTWLNDAGTAVVDVPDVAVAVTIAAARRAFINPDGLASESIADYSSTFTSGSANIYLTKAERTAVRRCAGRNGLWTLATTRSDVSGDTPSVMPEPWMASGTSDEELDPFSAGWPG